MPLDICTCGATRAERPTWISAPVREGEKVPSAAAARLGHFPRAPALILHVYSLHSARLNARNGTRACHSRDPEQKRKEGGMEEDWLFLSVRAPEEALSCVTCR
jgi:hypothetical protein